MERTIKIILGTIKLETQLFPGSGKIIKLKCQRKLRAESQTTVSGAQSDEKSLFVDLITTSRISLEPSSWAHSGVVPETSHKLNRENQGTIEHRLQDDHILSPYDPILTRYTPRRDLLHYFLKCL